MMQRSLFLPGIGARTDGGDVVPSALKNKGLNRLWDTNSQTSESEKPCCHRMIVIFFAKLCFPIIKWSKMTFCFYISTFYMSGELEVAYNNILHVKWLNWIAFCCFVLNELYLTLTAFMNRLISISYCSAVTFTVQHIFAGEIQSGIYAFRKLSVRAKYFPTDFAVDHVNSAHRNIKSTRFKRRRCNQTAISPMHRIVV